MRGYGAAQQVIGGMKNAVEPQAVPKEGLARRSFSRRWTSSSGLVRARRTNERAW
jgi:hypothetical protein